MKQFPERLTFLAAAQMCRWEGSEQPHWKVDTCYLGGRDFRLSLFFFFIPIYLYAIIKMYDFRKKIKI